MWYSLLGSTITCEYTEKVSKTIKKELIGKSEFQMASTAFGLVFTLIILQASISILTVLAGERNPECCILNMKIDHCNY